MACQSQRRSHRAPLCAAVLLALGATGAQAADQFRQAADGSSIECAVSARELTRFALIDDQFASVSKISSGTPYNDFAVTNEPLRGDIYVSVPETFAARAISFFATTRKGFVYKLACKIEPIPAVQVFIANPAIAQGKAAEWERETPLSTSAVRLIQAMANDRAVDGFEVRQSANPPARVIYGARLYDATRSLRISDPEFAANLDEHFRQWGTSCHTICCGRWASVNTTAPAGCSITRFPIPMRGLRTARPRAC